jgi:hypothetical protein
MTTAAEIRQQILDLQNRYNVGDIEVSEYNKQLTQLQLDLSNALQRETGISPVPTDKTEPVQQYQLRQKLQGRGGFTVAREIDEREAKRREKELGQSLSREEQKHIKIHIQYRNLCLVLLTPKPVLLLIGKQERFEKQKV